MKILAKSCFLRSILLIVCLVFSIHSFGYMPVDRNESPNPDEGLISVWLKPDWKVNDGIRHEIWSAGEEFLIDGIRCSEPARIKVNITN